MIRCSYHNGRWRRLGAAKFTSLATPLFSLSCNVFNGAHRAISISTSKHLFGQKLHPHNGNNAQWVYIGSLYNYGPGHTEALDISVISVFRIVAYAVSLLFHRPSSTLFLFTVHGRCRRRAFDWKERETHLFPSPTTIFLRRVKCELRV